MLQLVLGLLHHLYLPLPHLLYLQDWMILRHNGQNANKIVGCQHIPVKHISMMDEERLGGGKNNKIERREDEEEIKTRIGIHGLRENQFRDKDAT